MRAFLRSRLHGVGSRIRERRWNKGEQISLFPELNCGEIKGEDTEPSVLSAGEPAVEIAEA